MNTQNMQKYISGPVKVNIILLMHQKVLDTSSENIRSNAMEERVHLQEDNIRQFKDTII